MLVAHEIEFMGVNPVRMKPADTHKVRSQEFGHFLDDMAHLLWRFGDRPSCFDKGSDSGRDLIPRIESKVALGVPETEAPLQVPHGVPEGVVKLLISGLFLVFHLPEPLGVGLDLLIPDASFEHLVFLVETIGRNGKGKLRFLLFMFDCHDTLPSVFFMILGAPLHLSL